MCKERDRVDRELAYLSRRDLQVKIGNLKEKGGRIDRNEKVDLKRKRCEVGGARPRARVRGRHRVWPRRLVRARN
eukprot:2478704-Pleurochrysis_carterae.AAC.2